MENISVGERDKLYARYEAKLGREMISSLGSSIVSLYARALGYGLNLVDVSGYEFTMDEEDDLITDLEKDPFISSAFFLVMRNILMAYSYSYAKYTQVRTIFGANHYEDAD